MQKNKTAGVEPPPYEWNFSCGEQSYRGKTIFGADRVRIFCFRGIKMTDVI